MNAITPDFLNTEIRVGDNLILKAIADTYAVKENNIKQGIIKPRV